MKNWIPPPKGTHRNFTADPVHLDGLKFVAQCYADLGISFIFSSCKASKLQD